MQFASCELWTSRNDFSFLAILGTNLSCDQAIAEIARLQQDAFLDPSPVILQRSTDRAAPIAASTAQDCQNTVLFHVNDLQRQTDPRTWDPEKIASTPKRLKDLDRAFDSSNSLHERRNLRLEIDGVLRELAPMGFQHVFSLVQLSLVIPGLNAPSGSPGPGYVGDPLPTHFSAEWALFRIEWERAHGPMPNDPALLNEWLREKIEYSERRWKEIDESAPAHDLEAIRKALSKIKESR